MALGNYKPGLYTVDQYEMSGIPATGVANNKTVTFRRATSAITVWATGADATVRFGTGIGTAVKLPANESVRFEVVTRTLVCAGGTDVNFIAELTGIDAHECPDWDNSSAAYFTIA